MGYTVCSLYSVKQFLLITSLEFIWPSSMHRIKYHDKTNKMPELRVKIYFELKPIIKMFDHE